MKKLFQYSLIMMMLMAPSAIAGTISPFVDLFYWRATEEATSSWASDITSPQTGDVTFTPENVNFSWRPGFRLGATYQPRAKFWDTTLYWTHYSTKTSSSTFRTSQILLPEFFSGFLSGNFFFGAGVNWRINMNMVDFEISHAFKVAEQLSLRPAIGIKAGTIDQTINADWDAYIYMATERVTHKYAGAGPSLGLAANWNIYKALNLVGSFNSAYMWGKWDIDDTYQRPSALSGVVTATTIDTRMNSEALGTLMFDYFVGLELSNSHSPYHIKLGYEMQTWINQLRLLTFQQLPVHGDLSFQGATCRLQIDL